MVPKLMLQWNWVQRRCPFNWVLENWIGLRDGDYWVCYSLTGCDGIT